MSEEVTVLSPSVGVVRVGEPRGMVTLVDLLDPYTRLHVRLDFKGRESGNRRGPGRRDDQ